MTRKKYNPDKDLNAAVKNLLEKSEGQPFDMQIKAINTAISWEKCKNSFADEDDFDPEDL